MVKLKSAGDLEALRKTITAPRDPRRTVITICNGTGCHAHGCVAVTAAFQEEAKKQGAAVEVRATGCHGFCERGPLVVIQPQGIFYQRVRVKDVPEILTETVGNGAPIERLMYKDRASGEKIALEHDVPFYKGQKRLILGQNGAIDPTSIEDYFAAGGYAALAKALKMKPAGIIEGKLNSVETELVGTRAHV